jgi:uncharacterized protein (TIGR03437 family)
MTARALTALLLVATSGLAANLPRFEFTANGVGTAEDFVGTTAIAMDSRGNTYLTGTVAGSPFNATPGAFQSQNNGTRTVRCLASTPRLSPSPCPNTFVIKLDPSGAVVFATYLGGSGSAVSSAIAVDSEENVYVAGTFRIFLGGFMEGDFPVTPGAAFTNPADSVLFAGFNGFVAKLNASGTQLEYATLIPSATLTSIAVDGAGNAYFTGGWNYTYGPFPATPGAYQAAPVLGATIVGKLNAAGSALVYGTYLFGSLGRSGGASIAVDASGNVLVGGTNYGTTGAADDYNGYLAKLNSDGSDLIYATQLGPALVTAMKVSARGDIYVGCVAAGSDFPATSGGFGIAPPAGGNGNFLLHFSADGSPVLNSIYLPFAFRGLDVDSAGNAYVLGSGSVQTSAAAFQSDPLGGTVNAVIAKITPDGQVAGATYFGPSGTNAAAIAAERDGSVVVAGAMNPLAGGATGLFAANFFPAITLENSASYVANTVVPGELVSIQGYGIGPAAGLVSSPVTGLGGVQVFFDNFAAPITYAQADQINAQAPWEIAGQTTTQVRIVYNGVTAGSAVVPVGQALPGVFAIENSDASLNSPSNPARPGDFVAIYGTGGGAMSSPGVTGKSWPLAPLSYLTQTVSVTVGGEAAKVLYPGSAPTVESGFFQINVRLPTDLTAAAQFLRVTIGGVTSAPAAISIQ